MLAPQAYHLCSVYHTPIFTQRHVKVPYGGGGARQPVTLSADSTSNTEIGGTGYIKVSIGRACFLGSQNLGVYFAFCFIVVEVV